MDEEITTSEEYEAKAIENIDSPVLAGGYATLALAATLREATFVLTEALDGLTVEDEDEDEDDE